MSQKVFHTYGFDNNSWGYHYIMTAVLQIFLYKRDDIHELPTLNLTLTRHSSVKIGYSQRDQELRRCQVSGNVMQNSIRPGGA